MLQVSNYDVKRDTKGEGGDEGIGFSTTSWRDELLHEDNHAGY